MQFVWRIAFFVWLLLAGTTIVYAAVTVTAATGGTNISADRASNGTGSLWTTLGNIVINEWANGDMPANQTNVTLILTAPTGWILRANSGTFTFTAGRDITAISGIVTSSTITVTFTNDNNANRRDRITIWSIQAKAISWEALSVTGNILRLASNPGTATIAGITNNTTNFGSLSQVTWSLFSLAVVMSGQSFTNWIGVTGSPFFIFPNIQFRIASIRAIDQFKNTVTTFVGNKTLTYTGVSTASGANTYTTGVSFTAGASTTTLNTTLRTPWSYTMQVLSGTIVSGYTSSFIVGDGFISIAAPSSITMTTVGASTSANTTSGTSSSKLTIEDEKWTSTWHYTTLQCNALSNGATTIPNTAITLQSLGMTLLSGNTNPMMTGYITSPTTCSGTLVFLDRPSWTTGAGIYSVYGADILVTASIPAYQSIWTYTGNIVYTLISY